jgi:hypothetical protein
VLGKHRHVQAVGELLSVAHHKFIHREHI